jgi:hypothetical protein
MGFKTTGSGKLALKSRPEEPEVAYPGIEFPDIFTILISTSCMVTKIGMQERRRKNK